MKKFLGIILLLATINLFAQNNESGTKFMSSDFIREYISLNLTELINSKIFNVKHKVETFQDITFSIDEKILDVFKQKNLFVNYTKKENLVVYSAKSKEFLILNIINVKTIQDIDINPHYEHGKHYFKFLIKVSRDSGIGGLSYKEGATNLFPISQIELSFNGKHFNKANMIKDAFFNLKKKTASEEEEEEEERNKSYGVKNYVRNYSKQQTYMTTFNNPPPFGLSLYSEPNINSIVKYKCPKDSRVKVIDNSGRTFYKVIVDGYSGYISKHYLKKQ